MHTRGKGRRYKPEVQVYEKNSPRDLSPQEVPEVKSIGKCGVM
jgi:hypothetical protein